GAVRAEQGEDAPGRHLEVDAPQHVQVLVGLRDGLHPDRGFARLGGGHALFSSPLSPAAASIAFLRRSRSLSIHCLPEYACKNVSANSTGSSPTIARTGAPSATARSQRSAKSPNIV